MTRAFNNFLDANLFMDALARHNISYVAKIITPPKRLKRRPYIELRLLEVLSDG